MKIPDWLVNLSRPWNQMYREAWDAMTPKERRATFFMDVAFGILMITLVYLAGRF